MVPTPGTHDKPTPVTKPADAINAFLKNLLFLDVEAVPDVDETDGDEGSLLGSDISSRDKSVVGTNASLSLTGSDDIL